MSHAAKRDQYLDAQAGVIGSLLLDAKSCAGEVFLRSAEQHYTGEFKTLFVAARQLHQEGKPIDPVTVKNLVGPDYTELLLQLMEVTPTAVNCSAYVDLLLEQAQITAMQSLGLALAGCQSAEEAKGLIEQANRSLVQLSSLRMVPAQEGHLQFLARQETRPEYIPWGFPKLSDAVLSSLGDLVILGGRPSSGKTALSIQMAWEQAKTRKVGYFSFETDPDEVYDRLHAVTAAVDSGRIRARTLKKDELDRIIESGHDFESRQFDVIHAAQMTVSDVRSITVARGYQVIYLDYLQIVNPERGSSRGDRFGVVSQISMDLHRLAVSLGVLVVALSQLSRPEKQARSKAPDLYSLRESGQIEQDADAVFLLYRLNEDDNASLRKLRIAKNKKGLTGGYLEMAFDGPTQTFREKPGDIAVAQMLVNQGRQAKQQARSVQQARSPQFTVLEGADSDLPF